MSEAIEKQHLPGSEPTSRDKILAQVVILATFATSARLIQENELAVMLEAFRLSLAEIQTDQLIDALDLTIKARISSGNTYPISPIEIASRWKRGAEVTSNANLTNCTHCNNTRVKVIRRPNERPVIENCHFCNS